MRHYSVLSPEADLIEAVADRLVPEGNDLSDCLVVFPGKRPTHFLRRCLAQRIGTSYIPPTLLSMEEFVDWAYARTGRPWSRKMETIDALAFLFEIHRGMEKPVGGGQFLSLETFFPLGVRIYRDIEELLIEQVDLKRLKTQEAFIDDPLPVQTGAGLQSLSFFFERFYPAVEGAGFSTRSQRYLRVASEITGEMMPQKAIIFAGFYGLTRSEEKLFAELLSWEHVFFLFQEGPGIAGRLARLGIDFTATGPAPGGPPEGPEIFFHKSPDSHGQVFGLSGVLEAHREALKNGNPQKEGAGKGEQGDAEREVIVLPSAESLFPVLYHALPLIPQGDYNISLGYPLERTPTWGFLSCLMQAIMSMDEDRVYIPDYLGLMLHPYAKNIYLDGSAQATRIIFHCIEEILLQDRARSFVGLGEIEERQELWDLAKRRLSGGGKALSDEEIRRHVTTIHDALIRKASSFADIKDFSQRMMEILAFIYEHSSARLHPYFHPFAETFMESLDSLGRSRVRDLAFAERKSYFLFFKKYVSQCFTPFEGTPLKGMQVLGFLETRNLHFQRTYILDANEDVIPDTRKEESLLPFKVRQRLGLPTYLDRDGLSAYYFETLVRGSREVHLFFVENGRKEKSRFVEKLLWERQKRDRADSSGAYVRSLSYRLSLEHDEPPSIPKTPSVAAFLRSRPYDATSLDVYLRCPLQFYYRYVLNLTRKEEVSPDIERLDIGRLVHEILLRYFEKRRGKVLTDRHVDLAEMQEVIRIAFQEAYGTDPMGQAYLLKGQIERHMEAFLTYYQAPLVRKKRVRLLSLEERLEASMGSFRFIGVLDRIEERDDKICILDYKTGSSASRLHIDFNRLRIDHRASWGEAIGSLQAPFYLLLYGEASKAPMDRLEAMFLLLGKVRIDREIELPLFGPDQDAKVLYGAARQVIFALAEEIADQATPFAPHLRSKNACLYCDYRSVCGQQA